MKETKQDIAVRLALACAAEKNKVGKLIKSEDEDFDFLDNANYQNGDPETIYSLSTLYSEGDDVIESAIQDALIKEYPEWA